MGNNSSSAKPPQMDSPPYDVSYQVFKELPRFSLLGKRVAMEVNKFNKINLGINELLFANYEEQYSAIFRLSPAEHVEVLARIRQVGSNGAALQGEASVDYDNREYVSSSVATVPHPIINTSIRYNDNPVHHSAGRTKSVLPTGLAVFMNASAELQASAHRLPTLVFGANYHNKFFNLEGYANTNHDIGGWSVLKLKQFGIPVCIAARTKYNLDMRELDQLDCYVSFSGGKAKKGRSVTESYKITVGFSNLGETISASYIQHLKLASHWTGYMHPVTLGGEFAQHAGLAGIPPRSVLTVGGAWQISRSALIQAKANTQGNIHFLSAIRFGSNPMMTLTANVGHNFVTKKPSIGFSVILED